jgi:hypothetical protein
MRVLVITSLTVGMVASAVSPTVLGSRTAGAVAAKPLPSPVSTLPLRSRPASQQAPSIDWLNPARARLFLRGRAFRASSQASTTQPVTETSQRRAVRQREFARAIGALHTPWTIRMRDGVVFSSSSRKQPTLRSNAVLDPGFANALGLTRWRFLGPGGVVLFENTPQ